MAGHQNLNSNIKTGFGRNFLVKRNRSNRTMDKPWVEMTPDERREERFQKWLAPPEVKFPSRKIEQAYRERTTRFIKTIRLEKPDRVPVILPMGFFPAFHAGANLGKVMYDYRELRKAWKAILSVFDLDVFDSPILVWPAKAYELLDYKLYKWPGHGLDVEASSFQYIEGEYMKAEEYEALFRDPVDYGQRVFLPRVFGALEPFKNLPAMSPLGGMPASYLMSFSRPDIRESYEKLIQAGIEMEKWGKAVRECRTAAVKAGFPILRGGFISAPFDAVGDTLRGTQGIIMDMYRQPDKIFEAIEKITPLTIKTAIAAANSNECPIISVPLHKGEDGFMSQKQYEKFYWPSLKQVLLGLINEGIVPLVFAEGRYASRLETIKDVPRGAMIWWFEQTDMGLAKKILGNTACIAGNVPVSLLVTGTPDQIKEYCRKTIEMAGDGGGLILNGAAFMHKGNPANLQAMLAAAKEYGRYY
jgi:hypothetical protein